AVEQGRSFGNLVERLDEYGAPPLEPIDHILVVHDLVVDVDGRSKKVECPFEAFNRHIDPGAESAGVGQDDLHDASSSSLRRVKRTYPRRWAVQGEGVIAGLEGRFLWPSSERDR